MLKKGVRLIWRQVRGCLEDQRCSKAMEHGQAALEKLQEERSEQAASEKAKSDTGSDKKEMGKAPKKGQARLYPSLSELEDSDTSTSMESEEDEKEEEADMTPLESLRQSMYQMKIRKKAREKQNSGQNKEGRRSLTPSAPPPYPEVVGTEGGMTFNPEVWREVRTGMLTAFPVFQDQQGNRYHEPLDFKTVKALAESVRTYGISAAFTMAQVEALHRYAMTPADWTNLARACLPPGQYLDRKAFFIEFANIQAARNLAAGDAQAAWDADMLLGQGRFAAQQNGYPRQVYDQINILATRTWKSLLNKGEVIGN